MGPPETRVSVREIGPPGPEFTAQLSSLSVSLQIRDKDKRFKASGDLPDLNHENVR